MSNIDPTQLLAQMRATAARLEQPLLSGSEVQEAAPNEFRNLLAESIDKVSETQTQGAAMAESFERGEPGVSLDQVMLQLEKANLSFRAMTEVRNKLVTAYQEIMNMPV